MRFLQNVFIPERQGADPQWILVSEISSSGMRAESTIPMTIRTAASYAKGDDRVEVRGKGGAAIETLKTTAAWNRKLIFKFTPKGGGVAVPNRNFCGGRGRCAGQ